MFDKLLDKVDSFEKYKLIVKLNDISFLNKIEEEYLIP